MTQTTEVLLTEIRGDIKKYEAALRRQVNATNKAALQTERRFQRLSRKIERDSTSIARTIGRGFTRAKTAALGLFGFLGVNASFRALDNLAETSITTGDDVAKMAAAVDLSVASLQELRFAAERSGGTVAGLDSGLVRFTKTIGEARAGTGALFTILDRIDPDTLAELQNAESTEQALNILLQRLNESEDAFDRNVIASAAFGRTAGASFAKLAVDADNLRARFRELGGGISDELAAKAEQAQDDLTDLDVVLSNRLNVTVLENIEGFIRFRTLLNEIAQGAVTAASKIGNVANTLDRFLDRQTGTIIRDEVQVQDLLARREKIANAITFSLRRIAIENEGLSDGKGVDEFLPFLKQGALDRIERHKKALQELGIEQVRVNRAIEEAQRRERQAEAQTPPPVGGGDGGDGGGGFIDPRELQETENLIRQIETAWRDAFETEGEGIERNRRERLAAINESVANEREKARAIRQINQTTDEQLRVLRDMQAQEERDLVETIIDQRDRAAGRIISATAREFDARRAFIEREITDEQRRNEALQALAEERAAFEAFERQALPGQGLTGFEQDLQEIALFESEKLAIIEDAYSAQLISLEDFERGRRQIIADSEAEILSLRRGMLSAQLSDASGTFGALANVVRGYADETSAVYQGLFAVQKAFAVSSAIISTANGVTKALESAPPPISFVNAALVAAAGAAEIATITSQGFSRGGMVRGPGGPRDDMIPGMIDGRAPIRVSNGEFIVNAEATRRNRAILEAINSGAQGFREGGFAAPQIAPPPINIAPVAPPAPAANGPAPEANVTVVNSFDPVDVLEKALATRAGQKLVLNTIGRNRSTVNAELGARGRVS